jgi:hypothetical protein
MAQSADDKTKPKCEPALIRCAGATLFALLAAAIIYFAAFHARFIALPGAQEARESSITLTTGLILAGGRPYTLSSSPAITNVYGVVYNYLVAPAAQVWGSTFAVHRIASLVFLIGGAALLYALLRKENVGRWLALGGAVFYYLINATTYVIGARPDSLGNAIYLAVVLLVWPGRVKNNPSMIKLVLSAALGVLAFYTKPYFVLALALAAGVLFVSAGWRWAAAYAVGAGALLAASFPVVEHFWPYYLFEVYTSHVYSESDVPGYFSLQINDFLILHAGMVIVAVAAGLFWIRHRANNDSGGHQPIWRQWWPDACAVCLLVSLAALVRLGAHVGAFRIYGVQLVSPFLILVALRAVASSEHRRYAIGLGLLAANALVLLTWGRPAWPLDTAPTWNMWHKLTAGQSWQLLPPAMLPDVATVGVPVIDNGQVTFFANLALDHLPPTDPAYRRVIQYLDKIHALILQRRFDVIVSPNDFRQYIPAQLLTEHYVPHFIVVPFYFADYATPDNYGSAVRSYVAWIRKLGPEHAWQENAPAVTPAPIVTSASIP